jgi:hypothetical protein
MCGGINHLPIRKSSGFVTNNLGTHGEGFPFLDSYQFIYWGILLMVFGGKDSANADRGLSGIDSRSHQPEVISILFSEF